MSENYLKKELYDLLNSDSSIFEFIQSGSLDGIWYWDLEKPENEWMSPKFWETLGFDPNSKKHQSSEWQDIIFEDDLTVATENFIKHCENASHPYDQIVRYKHKDGSTVWIRCRGLAIRDINGKAIRMLGAHADITSLKKAEAEISRLTEEYKIVFNGTQDAMFLVKVLDNGEFRYIQNNIAHQNKTTISLEQIINKTPQELLSKDYSRRVIEQFQKCVDLKSRLTYEEEMDLPEGRFIWLTTLTPIIDQEQISYIVGSSSDITERKKLELELDNYANYDKLTGLPNRRLFFEKLGQRVLESERDQTVFALLFVDLDGFKSINDCYGHEVGDEVLKEVGTRLINSLRKSDTVARMGGDEFTIIVRHLEMNKSLVNLIEKIQNNLKVVMQIGENKCYINSSIGVAIYPENGTTIEDLYRNADAAMYEVKKEGKEGYKFYVN